MTEAKIRDVLKQYFPGSFKENLDVLTRPEAKLILDRLRDSPQHPLNRTQANQIVHGST